MTAPGVADGVSRLTADELIAAVGRGEPITVLDVRRRGPWSADPVRIPGALWVPLLEVPRRARDLPRDSHLVVYCA